MIQESTWGEWYDISFNRRLRQYLLKKMPVLNGIGSLFPVVSVLMLFVQSMF